MYVSNCKYSITDFITLLKWYRKSITRLGHKIRAEGIFLLADLNKYTAVL